MKKEQRFGLHQQPSRKSPRLSSSAAAIASSPSTRLSDEPKPGPEARPDYAWALSLHVTEEQPLSICYPSPVEDNSVRRSSRFTPNKHKAPSAGSSRSRSSKHTPAVVFEMRRSGRSSSSSSAPALTVTVCEDVASGEAGPKKRRRLSANKADAERSGKKAVAGALSRGKNINSRHRLLSLPKSGSQSSSRGCLSERCLRSRTVLMSVGDGGDFSIKERRLRSRVVRYAVVESPEVSEKSVMRSRSEKGTAAAELAVDYALIEMPDIDDSAMLSPNVGEILRIEMLASPEKSTMASEKCLRSRTVKMHLQEEMAKKGGNVKSVSSVNSKKKCPVTPIKESSHASKKRDKYNQQLDLEGLRSRKIQLKVKVDESAARVADAIEGGSSGESTVKSLKMRRAQSALLQGSQLVKKKLRKDGNGDTS